MKEYAVSVTLRFTVDAPNGEQAEKRVQQLAQSLNFDFHGRRPPKYRLPDSLFVTGYEIITKLSPRSGYSITKPA